MKYHPKPIDTSDINLPPSIKKLVEELAKNAHEIWARNRVSEGWTLGPERNDALKQTPCLVDYHKLPDSEKQYDRDAALETLKLIVKLGYEINDPKGLTDEKQYLKLSEILKKFDRVNFNNVNEVVSAWINHDVEAWQQYPEIYQKFGENVLKAGEVLIAYDIFSKGLDSFGDITFIRQLKPEDQRIYIRLRQLKALASAQGGALHQAQKNLTALCDQGVKDGETMGILGRTYKDSGMIETSAQKRKNFFKSAFSIYYNAFVEAKKENNKESAYYNGINAATTALLAKDSEQSRHTAQEVADICFSILEVSKDGPYWLYATLGEAKLLLGDFTESEKWYKKAVRIGKSDIRGRTSMQKQVRLILQQIGKDSCLLDSIFDIPSIVVFSGHMIDAPDRPNERFPSRLEEQIRHQIAGIIKQTNAGIAYSSAACGADIIFLEEMLKQNGEINIILPFEKEKFIKERVGLSGKNHWKKRFEKILQNAGQIKVLTQFNPDIKEASFDFANLFILGSAVQRAQNLGTHLKGLTVWDENRNRGNVRGTFGAVSQWEKVQLPYDVINPMDFFSSPDKERSCSQEAGAQRVRHPAATHHIYLPMMFADVKGYSGLNEDQLVSFSVNFLKKISKITKQYDENLLSKRTQGDGMFIVFKSLSAAVELARDLQSVVAQTDWSLYGLPRQLYLRVSLDAGPCYSFIEPVTGNLDFCGDYVNRAARIEPITPPGSIYASDTFVALCHSQGI